MKRTHSSKRICKIPLCLGLVLLLLVSCKTNESLVYATIETKAIASEMDGSYVLRVQGKGTTATMAKENAIKNAVHDAIFKNIYKTYDNHNMIYALVNDPSTEQVYKDFFQNFFASNGEYLKYVDTTKKDRLDFNSHNSNTVILNVVVKRSELERMLHINNIIK